MIRDGYNFLIKGYLEMSHVIFEFCSELQKWQDIPETVGIRTHPQFPCIIQRIRKVPKGFAEIVRLENLVPATARRKVT